VKFYFHVKAAMRLSSKTLYVPRTSKFWWWRVRTYSATTRQPIEL